MTPEQISAQASVVVVPRESNGGIVQTLDLLLQRTAPGFELIVVISDLPAALGAAVRRRLADVPGSKLIECDCEAYPNIARNAGWRAATKPFVAFLDNDAEVSDGWLDALVRRLVVEDVDVVGPLYVWGEVESGHVHNGGGRLRRRPEGDRVWLEEIHDSAGADSRTLHASAAACDFVEMHCLAVRRDFLARIGGFDDRMAITSECVDFGLAGLARGAKVWVEPAARVAYAPGKRAIVADWPLYRRSWDATTCEGSMRRLEEKWRLDPGCDYFVKHRAFLEWQRGLLMIGHTPPEIGQRHLPPVSGAVAQTGPGLFRQLVHEAYSTGAIECVGRSHALACRVLPALLLASEKPLLAHAAGTASVLASYQLPWPIVAAGLLAEVPTEGDGAGSERALYEASSNETVSIVTAYRRIADARLERPLDPTGIDLLSTPDGLALIVQCASWIDELTDQPWCMGSASVAPLHAWMPAMQRLAQQASIPGLAKSLETAVAAIERRGASAQPPARLGHRWNPAIAAQ